MADGCRLLSRRPSRGYLVVASALGCLPRSGLFRASGIAFVAIVSAASLGEAAADPRRTNAPARHCRRSTLSPRARPYRQRMSLVLGFVQRLAGPSWAGLVSTFPSMSLVVLAVTHLEAGPAEASRIARVLPVGNSSTLAFLAMFHLANTRIGLTGGMLAGYAAAVTVLMIVERTNRILGFIRGQHRPRPTDLG